MITTDKSTDKNTDKKKTVSQKIQKMATKETSDESTSLLVSQHREVEALFSEIENAGEKAFSAKKKLFQSLNEKLTLHAKLEEAIFYPAAKKIDDDGVFEGIEEHENIKAMLQKISSIETSDETFDAKIKVLKELVEHHIKEEETELFPECRKGLSETELAALGKKMVAWFEKESVNHKLRA